MKSPAERDADFQALRDAFDMGEPKVVPPISPIGDIFRWLAEILAIAIPLAAATYILVINGLLP